MVVYGSFCRKFVAILLASEVKIVLDYLGLILCLLITFSPYHSLVSLVRFISAIV
jgi:hypothetical protein